MAGRIPPFFLILMIISLGGCVKRLPAPDAAPVPAVQADIALAEELESDLLMAHYFRFSGQMSEAINAYQSLMRRDPQSPLPPYYLASFFLELSLVSPDPNQRYMFLTQASDTASDARTRFPDFVPMLELYIDVLIETQQFSQAIDQLRELMTFQPGKWQHTVKLGKLLLQVDRPQDALSTLQSISDTASQDLDYIKTLSLVYAELKDYKTAVQFYKTYLQMEPQDYEANYNYALVLLRMGDPEGCERILNYLIQLYPDAVEPRRQLSEILNANGRLSDAVAALEPLLENPMYASETALSIGKIFLFADVPAKAREWFETSLEHAPANRSARFYLALAISDMGDWVEAESVIAPLLRDRTPPVQLLDLAAGIKFQVGRFEEAINILKMGIIQNPESPVLYLRLADLYSASGMLDLAVETLRDGLKTIPGDKRMTIQLILALDDIGEDDSALAMGEVLLAAEPADPELNNLVGYLLADANRDLERAESLIDAALAANPDSAAIKDSKGWVLFRRGRYREALTYLQEAYQSLDKDPVILIHLAETWLELGDVETALKFVEESLQINPDNPAALQLKESIRESGQ